MCKFLLSEEYQPNIYCDYRKHCIYTEINLLKKPKKNPPEAMCSSPGKGFQLDFIIIYNLSSVYYW